MQAQQDKVNAQADYAAQVAYAKDSWDDKPRTLFDRLRAQLEAPLSGNSRCVYCEDSLADEIEHMRPKQFFPDLLVGTATADDRQLATAGAGRSGKR